MFFLSLEHLNRTPKSNLNKKKKRPRNRGSISDRDLIFLLETVQIDSRPRTSSYIMYISKSFQGGKAAEA